MKKNIWVIAFFIVSMLLAGTIGYIVAENMVTKKYESSTKKEEVKEEVKEESETKEEVKGLDLNDSLVTSLVYPKYFSTATKNSWVYTNETIETLGRKRMMHDAASYVRYSEYGGKEFYSPLDIKNSFVKIYGPDTEYYDGDIEGGELSCEISEYDRNTNTYIAYTGCGGAGGASFNDIVSKSYKAEQSDEYIYVYEYVQFVSGRPENENDWESPQKIYLTDNNYNDIEVLNGADESNYETLIYQMMDKGEVDTYKWTFKKQSDGKHYFYSGNWED